MSSSRDYPKPHPLSLFSLVPYNEKAAAAVTDACNKHLVTQLRNGTLALNVGHFRSKSSKHTLATLGRGDTDIYIPGSSISRIQCSFEINPSSNAVMFYDRSHCQTSQVYGEHATPFEYGRTRKVVVQKGCNTIIGMGGVRRDLVKFRLEWHVHPLETMQRMKERLETELDDHPNLARTDEGVTTLPSGRETRPYSAGIRQLEIRYAKRRILGSGAFGEVHVAINMDSGDVMAVKTIKRPPLLQKENWQANNMTIKREVDILSGINHPHIVDYLGCQGWDTNEVEIFMGLKDGSLESLVNDGCPIPIQNLVGTILHHMLQAIDCLASKGLVHRDVKPENILYVLRSDGYHFQLGDFGLSNRQANAATIVGSPLYMAPEIVRGAQQTHKMDVWSLYVTMLWTLDVNGFRTILRHNGGKETYDDIKFIAAQQGPVASLREMAKFDPNERASAAQMLIKCYRGEGLSTRQRCASVTMADCEPSSAFPIIPTQNQTGDERRGRQPDLGNLIEIAARRYQVPSPGPRPSFDFPHNVRSPLAQTPTRHM